MAGLFITMEGVEGSGKSTQMRLLVDYLEREGRDALALREPGGTAAGEKIRSVLLNETGLRISPWTELFLYEAARAQLVREVIRPSLERGITVVCDRYTDSTVAYQGYGRGLDVEAIRAINAHATGGLSPDLTLLIDLPPEEGLRRAWARISRKEGEREDRFEREEMDFHRRVRAGYLEIARLDPGRVKVLDGTQEISSIHRAICDIMKKNLF